MSEFDNVAVPPPAPQGEVSSDQRTLALVAHLLGLFTWCIGSLVIWLVNKDDPTKAFVVDQAKEALNFQITLGLAALVCAILMVVVIGLLLMPLVGLAGLVFAIIAAVKANNGEAYRYPFILRLVK